MVQRRPVYSVNLLRTDEIDALDDSSGYGQIMTLKQQSGANSFQEEEVSYKDPLIEGMEQSLSNKSVSDPSNDNNDSNRAPNKKKTSDESILASAVDGEANQVRESKSTRKANLKVRLENI